MRTVEQDRKYKIIQYTKGYSVDFDDMPYAYYDTYAEAKYRFDTDRMAWYGYVQ